MGTEVQLCKMQSPGDGGETAQQHECTHAPGAHLPVFQMMNFVFTTIKTNFENHLKTDCHPPLLLEHLPGPILREYTGPPQPAPPSKETRCPQTKCTCDTGREDGEPEGEMPPEGAAARCAAGRGEGSGPSTVTSCSACGNLRCGFSLYPLAQSGPTLLSQLSALPGHSSVLVCLPRLQAC